MIFQLDFIKLVIADQKCYDRRLVSHVNQGLNCLAFIQSKEGSNFVNCLAVRRGNAGNFFLRHDTSCRLVFIRRHFKVGSIAGLTGVSDGILTRYHPAGQFCPNSFLNIFRNFIKAGYRLVQDHPAIQIRPVWRNGHEFLTVLAPHSTTITDNGFEIQLAAGKDFLIGILVFIISYIQAVIVSVETVGIFHDKLTRPQESVTGTFFIAVFRLNLIEIERQLFIGFNRITNDSRKGFLMGWTQDKVGFLTIFQFVEVFTIGLITARLAPEVCTEQGWRQHLYCTNLVKLFSHDFFCFFNHTIGQRQIRINSG